MKNFLKTGFAFLTIFTCFVSGGCFKKQKTYSNYGMSVTMDKGFVEKDVFGYTYYLQSTDSMMAAVKEEFDGTILTSDTTLEEYTRLVLKANNYYYTQSTRDGKYNYFTFSKTVSGKRYFYVATTHKADDAFWLIQFGCSENDKDEFEEKFFKWADTVTFESNSEENI